MSKATELAYIRIALEMQNEYLKLIALILGEVVEQLQPLMQAQQQPQQKQ